MAINITSYIFGQKIKKYENENEKVGTDTCMDVCVIRLNMLGVVEK